MSLDKIRRTIQIIRDNGDLSHCTGPVSADRISNLELLLGVSLPTTYRLLIAELGIVMFGGVRIYGIGRSPPPVVPGVAKVTLNWRERSGMPHDLVVVASLGEGTLFALDTIAKGPGDDCRVVRWVPGLSHPDEALQIEDESFGNFLLEQIWSALERVRPLAR